MLYLKDCTISLFIRRFLTLFDIDTYGIFKFCKRFTQRSLPPILQQTLSYLCSLIMTGRIFLMSNGHTLLIFWICGHTNLELTEQTIQCDYVDLLIAVYKTVNKFSKILYGKEMHIGRYENVYKQSLITSKELKAAICRFKWFNLIF